jgi:hypothetical protein
MSNTPFRIAPGENVTQPVSTESVLHKRIDQLDTKIDAGFAAFRQDMDILLEEAKTNGKWRGEMQAWRDKTSDAVRGESKTNLDQDGALAAVLVKVDAIEKKTDVQTQMLTEAKEAATKVYKNPAFRAVATALWTAFVLWLGSKGIKVLP